ncbi:unnamed protein product, partial [Allacma fusca]
IGVVTSLINSNLRLQPLKHSLTVANSKAIIYGIELSVALLEAYEELINSGREPVPLFSMGQLKTQTDGNLISLESSPLKFSATALELAIRSAS